jgi:hypothetical protein
LQPFACVTVKVWPAIVSVPVRAPPPLVPTVKPTVPFPVPLPPDVIVIHDALLVAVQPHAVPVVTLTVGPAPPLPLIDALVGLITYVQAAS